MDGLRRLGMIFGMIAMALFAGSLVASAQDYPTKPIRLIVVTAAGGLMDVAARG